jgi:L-serine dehydratase
MQFISIFNDVMGPVMRGPSSSHTAGAYRIGKLVRDLLADEPASVRVTFDPEGSMAPTYRPLGVDIALTSGIMGWSLLDERYVSALERAAAEGVTVTFEIAPLEHTKHPNGMLIETESAGGYRLRTVAEAVGGGGVRFVRIGNWPVDLDGKSRQLLVEIDLVAEGKVVDFLSDPSRMVAGDAVLLTAESGGFTDETAVAEIRTLSGVRNVWAVLPVFFVRKGAALFKSAEEMLGAAAARSCSLGEIALAYEAELLGMDEDEILDEMLGRFRVMEESVTAGFDNARSDMLLLKPSASSVFEAEREGSLAVGGTHARAAARAMAVMHCCNSRGLVCAAPTGGSAGTVPGVIISLAEERELSLRRTALALFAASAIGLVVARRATFAAELAGCQVEIGVAGAMAAAAVIEVAGGSARQAVDAAAISLQNTMGMPCDPVAGACEVPCHTRNAVAASSAFTCADLILGGYANPIPLDEAIDASFEVGKSLPSELRCTARGGCAVTPSALKLRRRR